MEPKPSDPTRPTRPRTDADRHPRAEDDADGRRDGGGGAPAAPPTDADRASDQQERELASGEENPS